MKFFSYDNANGEVILNEDSVLLITEFRALLEPDRNKTKTDKVGKKKELAFKEIAYIYLFFDWESPYFQFAEQDRHIECLKDSGLTQEQFNDPVFRSACKKYDEMQNSSKVGKLLKASYSTIDKITHYLETLDLNERDEVTGKPIFKTKDVIAEISSASKLIDAIQTLELSFKKNLADPGKLRGDVEQGMFD